MDAVQRIAVGLYLCTTLLFGCSTVPQLATLPEPLPRDDGVSPLHPPPADLSSIPNATPKVEKKSKYGNPASYEVFGKRYYTLSHNRAYSERGIASWYGSKFHGQRTSSGESYDMYAMTAAHKSLPLPSYVRVTNLRNQRSIVVKVNDRGPFHDNRLIDLSYTAAWKLGIIDEGTGLVEVSSLNPQLPAPESSLSTITPTSPEALPELFLQVGAFGSSHNAQRLKKRLETQLQTQVHIQGNDNANPPIYRVQVGPIASVELADHLSQKLGQLGIDDHHVVIR
jgi:rare lipoprotein A